VRSSEPMLTVRPMRFASPASGLSKAFGASRLNPKGESYDIDEFGMVVTTKQEWHQDADRT
jgi:hypothetical protein